MKIKLLSIAVCVRVPCLKTQTDHSVQQAGRACAMLQREGQKKSEGVPGKIAMSSDISKRQLQLCLFRTRQVCRRVRMGLRYLRLMIDSLSCSHDLATTVIAGTAPRIRVPRP